MGAENVSTSFDGKLDKQGLKKAYQAMVKQDEYEKGHGAYQGTFPHDLRITGMTFKDVASAWDWLEDNVEKWEEAKAVYLDDPKKPMWLVEACVAI